MQLPETYISSMKDLLGEEFEEYKRSLDEPRAYGLRVNTGKISTEEFLRKTPFSLKPIPWVDNGFYYDPEEPVTRHPHYYAGLYYIQEPSAMVPASRLPIYPGDRVLDLCAAPGGKSTELAARLQGSGLLVANDISRSRAQGLLKNLERFGAGNILVTSERPEDLLNYFPEYFDKILVDAPCSGEGMFRKDPSMIKSWLEKGPESYLPIQREILDCAVRMLKPGGMLLYSTCTFDRREDEEQIAALLKGGELKLKSLDPGEMFREGFLPGTLRIYPQDVRGEGHFVALLQKKGGEEAAAKFAGADKEAARSASLPAGFESFAKEHLRDFPSGIRGMGANLDLRQGKLYLLPKGLPKLRGLKFLRTGLYLGEEKKNRFEPSQALAMYLKEGEFSPVLPLSSEDERVIRYLKGETIALSGEEERLAGFVLVLADGYPLGFGKAAKGTLKNKYNAGWRMQG